MMEDKNVLKDKKLEKVTGGVIGGGIAVGECNYNEQLEEVGDPFPNDVTCLQGAILGLTGHGLDDATDKELTNGVVIPPSIKSI